MFGEVEFCRDTDRLAPPHCKRHDMLRNRSFSGFLAGAILTGLLLAVATRAEQESSAARLGKKIDNFNLRDAAGKPWSLYDLKDRKAIVVVFLSFDCPVSTNYSPTLAALAKEYADRVAFLGICLSEGDDA